MITPITPEEMFDVVTGEKLPIDPRILSLSAWLNDRAFMHRLLDDQISRNNLSSIPSDHVFASVLLRLFTYFLAKINQRFIPITATAPVGIDTILVLGNILNKDATMSDELIRRLEKTYLAYKLNLTSTIIVSGGGITLGISEAELMKNWLVGRGVFDLDIKMEGNSQDTVENILFSSDFLISDNARNILLISGRSHIKRSQILLTSHLENIGHSAEIKNYVSDDPRSKSEMEISDTTEELLTLKDMGRILGVWKYPERISQ